MSALSDTAKQTVPCELNQDLVLDIPKENESPDKEALTEDSLQPVKRVKLTMADLMRAKKRMAEQKKLILEHGEVRPAQKPRIKTRPVKKKVTRKLQANDVFHRTEGPGVATETKEGKTEMEATNPIELPAAPMKKRIVNRKDKLLAEHRSQSLHMEEMEGEQTHLAPLKRVFTCPICSAESNSCKDHYQHIKEQHIPGPPYQCPSCQYTNPKLQQTISHLSCHSDRPQFGCRSQGCDFRTDSVVTLRKHQKIHGQPRFTCLICSKSFGHKYTLEQHQAVHTDERKFKCTICSFSTKYNSHLAAHRRVHEGNVHRCTFEGCQYWSAKFTLLKAHLRAHNGEKNFKCDQCGKAFVEAGQLRRHIKTHSGTKPFNCPEEGCAYATNRRDKLKEHQARTHKVAAESSPPKNRPSKLVLSMIQQTEPLDQSVFSPSEVPYVKEEILGY